MPIWVNETKAGFEFVCMCDQCGVEGPPSPSDDEAVEGFHTVHEEGRDTIYHCPFCHVLLEEGPLPEEVVTSRVVAILQQQGRQLSFVPGTRARALVDQLVQNLVEEEAFEEEAFEQIPISDIASSSAIAIIRNTQPLSALKIARARPFFELPEWAKPGALVCRENTNFRIKQVTPSEVVLSNGSQLVVWSRSQQAMDQEFKPAVTFTRSDFLLEVEEE